MDAPQKTRELLLRDSRFPQREFSCAFLDLLVTAFQDLSRHHSKERVKRVRQSGLLHALDFHAVSVKNINFSVLSIKVDRVEKVEEKCSAFNVLITVRNDHSCQNDSGYFCFDRRNTIEWKKLRV